MKEFKFTTKSYHDVVGVIWQEVENPKGCVQLIHNFKGHLNRYIELAHHLNKNGYIVFGLDLLGHGRNYDPVMKTYIFDVKDGVKDVPESHIELAKRIKKKYSNLPFFLIGDGLGSFVARQVAIINAFKYDGYCFVGTSYRKDLLSSLKVKKSKEPNEFNEKTASKFVQALLCSDEFNFDDNYDWYSNDKREVFRITKDEYNQINYSTSALRDISYWYKSTCDKSNLKNMNKKTPILLMSGKNDVFNQNSILKYQETLQSLGFKKIKLKQYRNTLHAVFFDYNKEDAYLDLVLWLDYLS